MIGATLLAASTWARGPVGEAASAREGRAGSPEAPADAAPGRAETELRREVRDDLARVLGLPEEGTLRAVVNGRRLQERPW